ncbi:3-hydroxyacyl-CoA dehydrogenase family protein [Cohnella herbarum]|uniref:3-hydroxyacyl-CoA dehydrogenase family protein n=1 Tax=Cohnella herbarum TaxID=2728023 RepID=A0A7Z2VGI7_9BACL|nr:3-hydroxyacyl-CoA dehydrogenase NAD-binding domain-containing protein [Cohnella herbarum]QJD82803.1 3-hydroxyacyl-CoA dehydrogenase family protein [Cohnella herbarum]
MIKNIAVLGSGTMGSGIALLFAEHGFKVALYEPAGRTFPSLDARIHFYNDLEKAVANADLIVEAVPEQLEIKREVFRQLAEIISDRAIVASNTSTISLQTLAENLPFSDRIVITHFFNPANLIPLVEIVTLPTTSPQIGNELTALLIHCGKTPVVLNRDVPGFVANRLQAALIREALYLVENGIADPGQIDTVVKEGLGLRWAFKGPFEIADLGGLDVWAKVTGHLFPELSTNTLAPESLLTKVADGELGVKSGYGYYRYEDPSSTAEKMKNSIDQLVSFKKRIEEV